VSSINIFPVALILWLSQIGAANISGPLLIRWFFAKWQLAEDPLPNKRPGLDGVAQAEGDRGRDFG
jgi:hypothetical protein